MPASLYWWLCLFFPADVAIDIGKNKAGLPPGRLGQAAEAMLGRGRTGSLPALPQAFFPECPRKGGSRLPICRYKREGFYPKVTLLLKLTGVRYKA